MTKCDKKVGDKCSLINVFVDDNTCDLCDGNPKLPKPVSLEPSKPRTKRTETERERVWQIHSNCENQSTCPECGMRDRIEHEDGHCRKGKW